MNWTDPDSRVNTLVLMTPRDQVESADIGPALESLRVLITPENRERLRRRLTFGIDGYEDDSRELFEIEAVRRWMRALDNEFPFWFYFMDLGPDSTLSLVTFALCRWQQVPGGKVPLADDFQRFLLDHFRALNDLCAFAGHSQDAVDQMSREIRDFYFGDDGVETDER